MRVWGSTPTGELPCNNELLLCSRDVLTHQEQLCSAVNKPLRAGAAGAGGGSDGCGGGGGRGGGGGW